MRGPEIRCSKSAACRALLPACATKIVVGMASPKEVGATIAYAAETTRVPPRLWAQAKEMGLLGPGVPVPAA